MTPNHYASRFAATAYDSPAHQTPFAALFSSCPSSGVESKAASSPAERNLFGDPTPSSPLRAFSPIPGANGYASTSVQQQAKSSHGMSKLVSHISNLKKQHAQQLAQQLKVGAATFMLALPVFTAACIQIHSTESSSTHVSSAVSEPRASMNKHLQLRMHSILVVDTCTCMHWLGTTADLSSLK